MDVTAFVMVIPIDLMKMCSDALGTIHTILLLFLFTKIIRFDIQRLEPYVINPQYYKNI